MKVFVDQLSGGYVFEPDRREIQKADQAISELIKSTFSDPNLAFMCYSVLHHNQVFLSKLLRLKTQALFGWYKTEGQTKFAKEFKTFTDNFKRYYSDRSYRPLSGYPVEPNASEMHYPGVYLNPVLYLTDFKRPGRLNTTRNSTKPNYRIDFEDPSDRPYEEEGFFDAKGQGIDDKVGIEGGGHIFSKGYTTPDEAAKFFLKSRDKKPINYYNQLNRLPPRSKALKMTPWTPCMKKYINIDGDHDEDQDLRTISEEVKEIARRYCKQNPWFAKKKS